MKFLIPLILLLPLCLSAKVLRGYTVTGSGPLKVTVDSIDYRKDLTRVYGTVKGRPHTSQRIDATRLDNRAGTDIDGMDFKRYFQWEDNGSIPVELDFPPMKQARVHKLQFTTVKGIVDCVVRKK